MSTLAAPAVAVDAAQVANLNDQVAKLAPGESFMAVIADGRVYVRSTRGVPQTVIRLWRKHPAMMIPDSAGYRPEVHQVSVKEL